MNKLYKTQQGFTIIEVVLVLAIAALILLMVFVALPAFSRASVIHRAKTMQALCRQR